jgi:hypothetical protein
MCVRSADLAESAVKLRSPTRAAGARKPVCGRCLDTLVEPGAV